jgi:hypothetical protein
MTFIGGSFAGIARNIYHRRETVSRKRRNRPVGFGPRATGYRTNRALTRFPGEIHSITIAAWHTPRLLQDGDVGVGVFPEGEGIPEYAAFATAAVQPSAPIRQTVGRHEWGRVRSQSSIRSTTSHAPEAQCLAT